MAEAALKIVPSLPNSLELTEAERRALLVQGLAELEPLIEAKADALAKIKQARKKIISHGFTSKVIDFALRLRNDEDDKAVEQRRAEAEVARFLNHPIGTEPELPFEDRTPAVDKAKNDGEIAGAEGKTCSAPFAPGSPNEQAWIKGWHEGQATITSAFKKLEAKAAAEPKEDSDEGDEG